MGWRIFSVQLTEGGKITLEGERGLITEEGRIEEHEFCYLGNGLHYRARVDTAVKAKDWQWHGKLERGCELPSEQKYPTEE